MEKFHAEAYHVVCANCEKDLDAPLVCPACLMESYCGRECQMAHWKTEHSVDCPEFQKLEPYTEDGEEIGDWRVFVSLEDEIDRDIEARSGRRGGRGGRPGPGPRGRSGFRGSDRWRDWRRTYRGPRPWLYPWMALWGATAAITWATAPFLYEPASAAVDPAWYFDPNSPPDVIERRRNRLRARYRDARTRGYEIYPDLETGRFRWIKM